MSEYRQGPYVGNQIARNCDVDCDHSKKCDADFAERHAEHIGHTSACPGGDDCALDYDLGLYNCQIKRGTV